MKYIYQILLYPQNIAMLSAHSQSDSLHHPQNRLPRRPNIQPHKPAALSSELHAGIQADTGLVDKEVSQLRVGHVPFAAIEPQQVGASARITRMSGKCSATKFSTLVRVSCR